MASDRTMPAVWLCWRLSGLSLSGAQALYQTTITLTRRSRL